MALLHAHEDDEYRAEFSTLVVRGGPWSGELPTELAHLNLDLLDEHAFAGWPKGDLGGAGNGWVQATTADRNHVTLQAHDAPPPLPRDLDEWEDVMETPFLNAGRGVLLTQVLSDRSAGRMESGPPGLYRVRICRRRLADRSRWALRFWPVQGVPEPPRRLARSRSAAQRADQDSGALAMGLVAVALWSPGDASRADLAERLLVSPQEVDAALRYAEQYELLHATGADTVTLTPVDRRPPEERDPHALHRQRGIELRAWADRQGIRINEPGRIPPEVIARYGQGNSSLE
ncbi:hypothetical protein ACQEU3_43025 [Spirillospora sp. CA-253888]